MAPDLRAPTISPPGIVTTVAPMRRTSMAAWVGRKRRGTTGVPWWKPISAAGNGSSVMRCARKPTSVKQPKWHSLSTSSTACWCWDARATSASYETTRTRDHCVHRLIHATRSHAAELDQHAVAGGLDDPAATLGDARIDQFGPERLEPRQRP